MKPSMDPGDFILWDSRAVHYGAAPTGENKRMAICKSIVDGKNRGRNSWWNRYLLQTCRVLNRRAKTTKGGSLQ